MTRAFVALQPPPQVLDAIAAVTGTVEIGDLRRSTREQWHVTVQFLGNVDDLDAIAGALEGLEAEPSPVRIGGAGAFPSARRADVLWLGVNAGRDWLVNVAADVTTRLEPLGFARDKRAYHPHLTLARARKRPVDVRAAVDALDRDAYGDAWTARELIVYESRTRPTGAEYMLRERVRLRA
jgi:2'-5' RNA ligase